MDLEALADSDGASSLSVCGVTLTLRFYSLLGTMVGFCRRTGVDGMVPGK